VAQDDIGREEAERFQPLDRRLPVACDHLLELVDRLADVDLYRHPQPIGLTPDLA